MTVKGEPVIVKSGAVIYPGGRRSRRVALPWLGVTELARWIMRNDASVSFCGCDSCNGSKLKGNGHDEG